jgi:hypothetical protein
MAQVGLGLPSRLAERITLPLHVVHVLKRVGVDDRVQDLLNFVFPLRDGLAAR